MGTCLVVQWLTISLIPGSSDGKASARNAGDPGSDSWVGKIPWRRKWQSTPALLPGKSHGRRILIGYSPWGRKESDTTERHPFHFSLSCTGEGNGNPLQCSCLENPRDRGAWWADMYGVTHSWPWLKRLSSRMSCTARWWLSRVLREQNVTENSRVVFVVTSFFFCCSYK